MDERKYCVYVHTNKVNGKKYVGVTSMKPEDRWKNGNGYPHNTYFTRAIKKYGWNDGFTHEIVTEDLLVEDAYQMERELIAEYDCINPNGYNATSGGEIGKEYSEELRQRLSEIITERMNTPEVKAKMAEFFASRDYWGENNPNYGNHKLAGENNPNWGNHLSEEIRQKISEANKGKTWSNERKKEFSEKMKGRPGHPCSEETKQKIREANTSRKLSDEQKQWLSERFSGENNPNYGKHISEEIKEKIRAKLKGGNNPNYGKPLKEEHRQKLSINSSVSKRVIQFDMDGNYITEYHSQNEAARQTGILESQICRACKEHKSAGGFLWLHKDEYDPNNKVIYQNNNAIEVVQLDLDGNFIAEFKSAREAERQIGILHQNINACCKNKRRTAKGYRWMYATEYYEMINNTK